MLIRLTAQSNEQPPSPSPCGAWQTGHAWNNLLKIFDFPPAPLSPSSSQLHTWVSHSLETLMSMIRFYTLVARPSPKSKPWWTPSLTTLGKEYAKDCRIVNRLHTENSVCTE